jgi:hypothetical protein
MIVPFKYPFTFTLIHKGVYAKRSISSNKLRSLLHHEISRPIFSNDEPPKTNVKSRELGSYCIRATTQLVHINDTNSISRSYEGYDTYTTIVDKVEKVCSRDKRMFGDDAYRCLNSKLFFTGTIENCNGRVEVKDHVNNKLFTV